MSGLPDWLPPLIKLLEHGGNWETYLKTLYKSFETDFVHSRPCFRGRRLGLKRHPLSQGKEATFWHMISEGRDEVSRRIDLQRCERIAWARAVIENADDAAVLVWETERRGERRICLWLKDQEYLVVLADRKGYLLPWTAYTVTRTHRKRKLQREYEAWRNEQARNG